MRNEKENKEENQKSEEVKTGGSMLKNPKFIGTIIAAVLVILGLITGMDVKKYVCDPQQVESNS